jgi:hypothetical protein
MTHNITSQLVLEHIKKKVREMENNCDGMTMREKAIRSFSTIIPYKMETKEEGLLEPENFLKGFCLMQAPFYRGVTLHVM